MGLYIKDDVFNDYHRIEYMPKLEKAYVDITCGVRDHKFLKAFTCARKLSLCLSFLEVRTTIYINRMFSFTFYYMLLLLLCIGSVSSQHDLPQSRLSDTEYMCSRLVGSCHSYAPRFSQAKIPQTP